jgi:ribosomal protein S18 acetylase RimI-like enzyme
MLTFRPAAADDLEYLYDLYRAAMMPYLVDAFGPWDEAHEREEFRRCFNLAEVRVIRWDGQDAGALRVQERAEELFIASIEVHPSFQRHGIGTAAVRAVIAEAARQSKPVALRVLKGNIGARNLYQRLGFGITGENDTHYLMARDPRR